MKKSFLISCRGMCSQCMILSEDRGMRFGMSILSQGQVDMIEQLYQSITISRQ